MTPERAARIRAKLTLLDEDLAALGELLRKAQIQRQEAPPGP